MDRMYRSQRHIYDASRKFYLLGRDTLIADLAPPAGASVLEIGCGTGRNLVKLAGVYPQVRCYGLDVSAEMLATAQKSVDRAKLTQRIELRQADATNFDPRTLFGRADFDRIVISYALSMIPPWEAVLDHAARCLAPGGSLHVVDFGDQAALPAAFRAVLNQWLAWFHVTPRGTLQPTLAALAETQNMHLRYASRFGGYAAHAMLERPVV